MEGGSGDLAACFLFLVAGRRRRGAASACPLSLRIVNPIWSLDLANLIPVTEFDRKAQQPSLSTTLH